jgi:(2Fe-2S) ferredoxin
MILPEAVWYNSVKADHVSTIIKHHLHDGEPVQALLYAKYAKHN